VRIRLKRFGRKGRPFYRVVVADARVQRDGKTLDTVGWYDPLAKEKQCSLDAEKVQDWLRRGAQPTETVRSLLQREKLWAKDKPPSPQTHQT